MNRESRGVLAYAGVNVSGLSVNVYECSSISTLELAVESRSLGKEICRWKCDRSSLVLLRELL